MSSNKDEAAQAAADRIKAAALSAAKGLSSKDCEFLWPDGRRAQSMAGAERSEAADVFVSTEKAVKLAVRKDLKPTPSSRGSVQQCQKCFQSGHWTSECKNERVYMSRPSRTQQLKNPKRKMRISVPYELDNPDIPQNALCLQPGLSDRSAPLKLDKKSKSKSTGKNKSQRKKTKRKRNSDDSSDSGVSESSVSSSSSGMSTEESDSETETSGSDSRSSGTSSESDSEEERRRRKKYGNRRHRKSRTSESDSESDSGSGSDSDSEYNRKMRRKHERKHHGRR